MKRTMRLVAGIGSGLLAAGTLAVGVSAADAAAPSIQVVAKTPVGDHPVSVAVSPDGSRAYVVNYYASTLSVIDTAAVSGAGAVLATVPVGSGPLGVAVSPDGQHAYVGNTIGRTLSVLSTSSNAVTATVPVAGGPNGVAVSPDGKYVYTGNFYDNTMSVIDAQTNTVMASTPVGANPRGVAISPDGKRVYVANSSGNSVSVIDTTTRTAVSTVAVNGAWGLAVSPDGSRVYVTENSSSQLAVLDADAAVSAPSEAVLGTVAVALRPYSVAVSPDGSTLYVVSGNGPGALSVLDAASRAVVATIDGIGASPQSVASSPDGRRLYVAAEDEDVATVLDVKAAQTVSFTSVAPGSAVVGGSYTPTATGGASGNAVVFSVDAVTTNAACSISGGVVSFDHAGSCVIDADQAGDADHAAAVTAKQTIAVAKKAQTVSFTSDVPTSAVVGGSYSPTATGGGSGNPVVFSVDGASTNAACSISRGVVSFDHVGSCVIDADQAGAADHAAAVTVQQAVAVGELAQTVSFTSVAPTSAVVGGSYTPTATGGGSGNAVVFSVDAATTNAACSTNAGVVSFDHAGSCVIDADQAGDADHVAALTVKQAIEVRAEQVSTPSTSQTPITGSLKLVQKLDRHKRYVFRTRVQLDGASSCAGTATIRAAVKRPHPGQRAPWQRVKVKHAAVNGCDVVVRVRVSKAKVHASHPRIRLRMVYRDQSGAVVRSVRYVRVR